MFYSIPIKEHNEKWVRKRASSDSGLNTSMALMCIGATEWSEVFYNSIVKKLKLNSEINKKKWRRRCANSISLLEGRKRK